MSAVVLVLASCSANGNTAGNSAATAAATTTTVNAPGPASDPPVTSGDATTPATSDAAVAVPAALAFNGTFVGGEPVDVGIYAGKAVAFWFWAPT